MDMERNRPHSEPSATVYTSMIAICGIPSHACVLSISNLTVPTSRIQMNLSWIGIRGPALRTRTCGSAVADNRLVY